MTITTEVRDAAHKILEQINRHDDTPIHLFYPHMRDGNEAEDWTRFRADLASFVADPDNERLAATIRVYVTFRRVMEQVVMDYIAERRAAERTAWLAATVEIQPWRGAKLAKAERIRKEDINAWVRPGHIVIERRPDVVLPEDRGNDELSFAGSYRMRTMSTGTELPEGTVRAKRVIKHDHGRVVQYLVKPRSKAAEMQYQMRLRLTDLEQRMRTDIVDHMTAEEIQVARAEIADLRRKLRL